MNWLREAISDSRTNKASSKRVALVVGAFAMAVAVIVLAASSLLGHAVAFELGAVCVPLAGLGGYSYTQGKATERQTQ